MGCKVSGIQLHPFGIGLLHQPAKAMQSASCGAGANRKTQHHRVARRRLRRQSDGAALALQNPFQIGKRGVHRGERVELAGSGIPHGWCDVQTGRQQARCHHPRTRARPRWAPHIHGVQQLRTEGQERGYPFIQSVGESEAHKASEIGLDIQVKETVR